MASYNADAATEYTQRKQRTQLNSRALLTPDEEARKLVMRVSKRVCGAMPAVGGLDVPTHSSAAEEIDSIEQELKSMLVTNKATERKKNKAKTTTQKEFPLSAADVEDNELGRTVSEN